MQAVLSVIIPTYRRVQSLQRTLQSLKTQNYRNFEILVVDNAGQDEVRQLIEVLQARFEQKLFYIRHTEGGSSGARMRGVRESKGEVLVFTDDDLTFEKNWLTAYASAFSEYPEMVGAGGRVKPVWEVSPPDWLLKYIGDGEQCPIYALIDMGQEFKLSRQGVLYSCNMALRKDIFSWTGLRPELFGRKTIGSGESGLNQELNEKGMQIGYIPDATVYHHIPSERIGLPYIRKWAWHLGGAQMYDNWHKKQRDILSIASELFGILGEHYYEWLMSIYFFNKKSRKAIDVQYKASLGLCKVCYLWWVLTDKQVQQCLDMNKFSL